MMPMKTTALGMLWNKVLAIIKAYANKAYSECLSHYTGVHRLSATSKFYLWFVSYYERSILS